jgi:hypothetical protein
VPGTVRFASLTTIVHSRSCGLGTDDVIYCWRNDANATPSRTWGDRTWVAISDDSSLCALDADGDLYCGGTTPQLRAGGDNLTSFSRGGGSWAPMCAIDADGFAYCEGFNFSGELGNGSTENLNADFEPVFPPERSGAPRTVDDLRPVGQNTSSITLSWTQVDDGTGNPAWYRMKYSEGRMDWPSATVGCSRTMRGTAIGSTMSCTVTGLTPATEYEFQLMAFRSVDGVWVASTLSGITIGTTASTAVDDLSVAYREMGGARFVWTQIDDGTGNPARYRLKHASDITNWKDATTICTVVGTAVDEQIGCSFASGDFYADEETFEIQLMSYRVDANGVWRDAKYSNLVVVPDDPYLPN